uniref:Uncharacterized protein n=1 Tax=Peronospora matthiolae TaxID=2874970 RepID=A0AAV1V3S8_9STRA
MDVIEPHVSAQMGAEARSDGLIGDGIYELRVKIWTLVLPQFIGEPRDFTSPEPSHAGRLDPEGTVQEGAKVNMDKAGEDRATIRDGSAVKATSIPPASGRQQS